MGNLVYVDVVSVEASGSEPIPKTTNLLIENTATAGIVSVSQVGIDGKTRTWYIAAGNSWGFSDGFATLAELTVSCDGDATAEVTFIRG